MHNNILKNLSWAMVFILFISWSGIPQNVAHAQKTARLSEEERKKAVEKLEKLFDALEEAAKEIPRDTFDPKAIVDKVGTDPKELFEWVRDNTYLVPYQGSLRGPIGVLMDRLGNSLDRALLLHELITIAGHKARLARGIFSKQQAEEILKAARSIPPDGALPIEDRSNEATNNRIKRYAREYGFDQKELLRIYHRITLKQLHLVEEAAQFTADQTAAILAAAKEAGISTTPSGESAKYKALMDHWWVQRKQKEDWIDLDPSLPGAKPGRALIATGEIHQHDELSEHLFHRVTIRVVIEQWMEGDLKEHTVLEHTLQPSKLLGKQIVLHHVPINWPTDFNLLDQEPPFELLKATVMRQDKWLPVLTVGSKRIVEYSFAKSGDVQAKPGKETATETGVRVGGMFGAFSRGLTGEEAGAPKEETHLTAEWIEYEIRVPEAPPRRIRRQVFDLLGPSQRGEMIPPLVKITEALQVDRGLILLGETQILLTPCKLSSWFVIAERVEHLLKIRRILINVARGQSVGGQTVVTLPPGRIYDFPLFRWQLSPVSQTLFLDRPNILAYHRELRNQQEGVSLVYAYDVVENQLAVSPASAIKPFSARLEQGIADTNAEGLLIGQAGIAINTAQIFQIAKAQEIRWVVIDRDRRHELKRLEVNEEISSLIEMDLSNGFVVVVPERPVRMAGRQVLGWWRIDPRDGDILGIDERGWGATLTEYEVVKWLTIGCLVGSALVTGGEIIWEPEKVNIWDIVPFLLCVVLMPATGVWKGAIQRGIPKWLLKLFVSIIGAAAGGWTAHKI